MEYVTLRQGGVPPVTVPVREIRGTPRRPGEVLTAAEVISGCFGSDVREEVRKFVRSHAEYIRRSVRGFENAGDAELVRPGVVGVFSPAVFSGAETAVDFLVAGRLEAWREADAVEAEGTKAPAGRRSWSGKTYLLTSAEVVFRARYLLDLKPCAPKCAGPLIRLRGPEEKDAPAGAPGRNSWLLPELDRADYARLGRRALEAWFPEAFPGGRAVAGFHVDADEMARRIGLKVRTVRFADPDILGQIWFSRGPAELKGEDGTPRREEIPACSVLLSEEGNPTPVIRRMTLVHEICHYLLDLPFFLLQAVSAPGSPCLTSRRKGSPGGGGPASRMEAQAETLPRYILMEEESVRFYVRDWRTGHAGGLGRIRRLIADTAARFEVSEETARTRLAELGFQEIRGSGCRYRDDGGSHLSPAFRCAGEWPEGVAYTLDAEELAALSMEDEAFDRMLRSGRYCLAEGHLVLRSSRWLCTGKPGRPKLKMAARRAADRCCVAFRRTPEAEDARCLEGAAARNAKKPVTDAYKAHWSLECVPGDPGYEKENDDLFRDAIRWGELISAMPDDFREAFDLIADRKQLAMTAVADEMEVSRKQLYNILSHAVNPADGQLIALCVAMHLPYDVSIALLERTRFKWKKVPLYYVYRRFLLEAEWLTVERCEDILREQGFPPLFAVHGKE